MITRLELRDFRCFGEAQLELGPGVTVFEGANGQGKTSLLEAIFFLGLLRSFRSGDLRLLRRWKCPSFLIRGRLENGFEIAVEQGSERRLRADGMPVARSSDFVRFLGPVALSPEDIRLSKGPAAERRQFLDILGSQLSAATLGALRDYDKALRQRNQLLRLQASDSELRPWEYLLARSGAAVMQARSAFFPGLRAAFLDVAAALFPAGTPLDLKLVSSLDCAPGGEEESLLLALEEARPRERELGSSSIGPHRDELAILLQGRSLASHGSEGQCRLAAISLRLAAAELLDSPEAPGPILLVDDVTGELDARRRDVFLQRLGRFPQVFIACTECPALLRDGGARVVQIEGGRLVQ
ncbi:MAG: hypothetical protein RL095_1505 [Verrucomicrobiota bacterium]|jgi:DNA replication and repair protein RecF